MFSLAMKHVMWEVTIAHKTPISNTLTRGGRQRGSSCRTGQEELRRCSVAGHEEDPLTRFGDADPPAAVTAEQ